MAQEHPVVWITGSGGPRVGRSIAGYFADRGYRIALHAHTSPHGAEAFAAELNSTRDAMQPRGIVTCGSVEDPMYAERALAHIMETFGRLDVLVNSAAIWEWKSLEETTSEEMIRHFQINALGTFLCSRAAGLQMVQQSTGGAIVLIGDWAVHRPYRDFSAYFASKGSIETMTRSLAVELAERNPRIRVNAILPGPVMLDPSIAPERSERIRHQSLLKQHGAPEHVASAAFFLAEHPFITGVCLPVDGGRSIYAGDCQDAIAHPTFAGREGTYDPTHSKSPRS